MKIKLTEETVISVMGEMLYRIEAAEDIPSRGIKKGDKGGFISSLKVNGSDRVSGNAWVYDNAQVFGSASVYGNATVYGNAQVSGNAQVFGNASVDSISAIIVIVIAMKYSVTITRKTVQIGCKVFKRSEIKKMTEKKAEKLGLPKEFFKGYNQIILGAMKLVKNK